MSTSRDEELTEAWVAANSALHYAREKLREAERAVADARVAAINAKSAEDAAFSALANFRTKGLGHALD